jgi:hypothetical protein
MKQHEPTTILCLHRGKLVDRNLVSAKIGAQGGAALIR